MTTILLITMTTIFLITMTTIFLITMVRVVSDYQEATVTTSLKTSTADLNLATFPKIVICNKFQLR